MRMSTVSRGIVVVLVTCPTRASARRVGERVIAERAAACVNIVPGLVSLYRWKGRVERAPEVLLVIKTTAFGFGRLRRTILRVHPYDTPEIIALPISASHPPYRRWVVSSVRPARRA